MPYKNLMFTFLAIKLKRFWIIGGDKPIKPNAQNKTATCSKTIKHYKDKTCMKTPRNAKGRVTNEWFWSVVVFT